MSKNHRGAGIRELPNHGRGKCPICGKENIKVLYEKEIDGQTVNICKYCNAKLKNDAKKDAILTPKLLKKEAVALGSSISGVWISI